MHLFCDLCFLLALVYKLSISNSFETSSSRYLSYRSFRPKKLLLDTHHLGLSVVRGAYFVVFWFSGFSVLRFHVRAQRCLLYI